MTAAASRPDGDAASAAAPQLRRGLTLPLLTLYGVGTTVGAGIYVLVGKVAGTAGLLSPLSFILAGILAALSACSFAELAARFPRSAGEALYVRQGFRSVALSTAVGLLVVAGAAISAATIAHGFVGYLLEFVPVGRALATLVLIAVLAAIAAWGIMEAVAIAAVLTVAEIGGLLLLLWAGRSVLADAPAAFAAVTLTPGAILGIGNGAILAFFAFIGFENAVNVAEEVRDVRRTLPRAIFLTMAITTVLYLAVALVATLGAPAASLAQSEAPLAFLYERFTGGSGALLSGIALMAVVNGALIQIVMAARVLYGMSRNGQAPRLFGRIHPRTRTPLVATLCVAAFVAAVTLAFPIEALARFTSLIVLVVFAAVNAALMLLKRRERGIARSGLSFPRWVPVAGCVSSTGLALFELARLAGAG